MNIFMLANLASKSVTHVPARGLPIRLCFVDPVIELQSISRASAPKVT